MHQIEIRTQSTFTVAAVEHRGAYMNISRAFESLYEWLGERGLIDPRARMVAVYFDDPSAVAEENLRSMACFEILRPDDAAFAPPVSRFEIAGGEFAVLRHVGPYAELRFAYQWLYWEWLPKSGRELGEAPAFEVYLNTPKDTAPVDLVTEIWVALRETAK